MNSLNRIIVETQIAAEIRRIMTEYKIQVSCFVFQLEGVDSCSSLSFGSSPPETAQTLRNIADDYDAVDAELTKLKEH